MRDTTGTPTLREVIDRHLAASDPRVLTAHDRLDVAVSWVHSSEIFEIGPLLSGGELLLTTGLGLAGLDAGIRRHYIRDLAERGVAALAFEIGRTFDEVPEEMIREGSAVHLPIIELRTVVPFIDVCRAANTAIVSDEVAGLRLRSTLDARLHAALTASGGTAAMITHIADATGCPIVLVGAGGALLAAHGADDDRAAWRLVDSAIASMPITVRDREIGTLYAGPRAGHQVSGPADPDQITELLGVGAGPVGAALTRSGPGRSAIGARLVAELLDGRPVRRADLYARLTSSGVPLTDSSHLVAVAIDAPDPRMAETVLARADASGAVVHATVDATVHALMVVPGTRDPADADADPVERTHRAMAAAAARVGRVTAVVGDAIAVGGFDAGAGLSGVLADALRTCSERLSIAIAERRDGSRGDGVFTSRELAVDAAARTLPDGVGTELARLLEPLRAHDESQSAQLAHTLDVHLRYGCSATRSAAALHIGRQSLYQRLDRIRGLLGFDPTTPEMYPSVLLALSVLRARPH
ncbi:PucR family transcriptional regulator [Gordonia sp. NB41Y]|uniref:PucR family transcriptional regulator n=1 Tax=Gordonia sp. NB41Y TaxID=875808 RepID=UPI00273C7F41|nr:PucR family transcriptional regulator [Gordonia sp. NB41Y]WLP89070.1 PucR family transcriptional regulator [Gordonia sp. NB41Y]